MSDLREALTEHLARRYWEHGMGGRWERPADAPDAPFPAYADDQEKAMCRAYVGNLLGGFDFPASPVRGIAEGGGITACNTLMMPSGFGCVLARGHSGGHSIEVADDPTTNVAYVAYRAHLDSGGVEYEAVRAALEAVLPLLGLQQVPTVLLDRNAVRLAIADELDGEGVVSYGLAPKLTDRVMDVAQQVPSREEIAYAVHRATCMSDKRFCTGSKADDFERADAVLALFSKPAAEPQCICHMIVDTYPDPDCPQYSEHVKPVEEGS